MGLRAARSCRAPQSSPGDNARCRTHERRLSEAVGAYCAITGDDVGAALVRNGWARPGPDAYDAEVAEARRNRAGLWNGDWTIEPSQSLEYLAVNLPRHCVSFTRAGTDE